MRCFEKISFEQFKHDIKDDEALYEEYQLPDRETRSSVGYDFKAIDDFVIKPGEIKKIPTGIKASFLSDEMLMLVVRSSMGFKYNVRMCNQVGIIDADFYNNATNEGHIWIALQNEGEKDYVVKKGDGICQGIFVKVLTCGETIENERVGWKGKPEGEENNGK